MKPTKDSSHKKTNGTVNDQSIKDEMTNYLLQNLINEFSKTPAIADEITACRNSIIGLQNISYSEAKMEEIKLLLKEAKSYPFNPKLY